MDSKTTIKDKMKKFNKSLFNRQEGRFLKAATAALIITTLTYNLAFAKEDTLTLEQIYHVYVGNEYMGAVNSEKTVDDLVAQKEEAASIQYKELSVDADLNIKVIPELVYKADTNNEETLEKLNDALVVEAEAYQVSIDGETVLYLKDAADYEEVIHQIKLQYVSQDTLDELNARQLSTEQVPPVELNETRILEISLKENVQGLGTYVTPDKVIAVEEAIELLNYGSSVKEVYKVQQGDVLSAIAKKYDLKLADLLALNPDITENTTLKIGQDLNVTVLKPLVSVEVVYENLNEEEIPFTVVTEEDSTMLKGQTKVTQQGVNGKKETNYKLVYVNGVIASKTPQSETIISEPIEKIVVNGTKVIPSLGTGSFVWPTNGGYISSTMGSRWGSFHRGIDIARPSDYTIKAADNGTVTFVGWDGSYGRKIVVDHNNGYQTVYAHLSAFKVSVGQTVEKGMEIGVMGSSGHSTGTHLHFEVLINGANQNPLSYLN